MRPSFSMTAYLARAPARRPGVSSDIASLLQFAALLHEVPTQNVEPLEALGDDYGLARKPLPTWQPVRLANAHAGLAVPPVKNKKT